MACASVQYFANWRTAYDAERIKLRHGCPGGECRAERKLVNTENDGAQKGGADVSCSALLDGNTMILNRIRAHQKEVGLKFPMTEQEALKLRGIGKKGLRIMQILGLVTVNWQRVQGNVEELEKRAAWFEKRARNVRKQIKEMRASMPSNNVSATPVR